MLKNKVLIVSLACMLVAASAIAASCASTKTLTVTQIQTRTRNVTATVPATIVKTITQTIGGEVQTLNVTLTGTPPLIPHPIDVVQGVYGACFQCHPIPLGHTGYLANQDVCTQCHLPGPIDPNLVFA
jgi:nitrate reductase cytochrome c-type subunit